MDTSVTIKGNVTRTDLRFTNDGKAILNFGVAVNHRVKGPDGNWADAAPSFFDCVLFGDPAENAAETIDKGTRVVVTGEFRTNEWNDRDTGEKRTKLELRTDEVAVSTKFASAVVTKVNRRNGDAASVGAAAAPAGDVDEAPF